MSLELTNFKSARQLGLRFGSHQGVPIVAIMEEDELSSLIVLCPLLVNNPKDTGACEMRPLLPVWEGCGMAGTIWRLVPSQWVMIRAVSSSRLVSSLRTDFTTVPCETTTKRSQTW